MIIVEEFGDAYVSLFEEPAGKAVERQQL